MQRRRRNEAPELPCVGRGSVPGFFSPALQPLALVLIEVETYGYQYAFQLFTRNTFSGGSKLVRCRFVQKAYTLCSSVWGTLSCLKSASAVAVLKRIGKKPFQPR